jgi:Zn finger protein HypA/HybF involved in hydrogenase expression
MTTFDDIRQKVKDVTRTAVKASSEFLEVTKINMAIKAEEDKIKAITFDIGKSVFDSYSDGKPVEEGLAEKCSEIALIQKDIEEMQQKVMQIKNVEKCPGCSAEVDKSMVFCPKCGTKVL